MKTARFAVLLAVGVSVALLPGLSLGLGGCRSAEPRSGSGKKPRPPYWIVTAPIAFQILRDSPDTLVLDLRMPQEFQGDIGHLARARNIPLDRLPLRLLEISSYRKETLVVYCRRDGCGDAGMKILLASGFSDGILIDGGIDAWVEEGFKTVRAVAESAEGEPGTNP